MVARDGMKLIARRQLPRGAVGLTLWLASFILGVALITGTVGGTGARAAHGSRVQQAIQVRNSPRSASPGVHGRLLLQRIGGTPLSSQ
jgi:hypothetical protein